MFNVDCSFARSVAEDAEDEEDEDHVTVHLPLWRFDGDQDADDDDDQADDEEACKPPPASLHTHNMFS